MVQFIQTYQKNIIDSLRMHPSRYALLGGILVVAAILMAMLLPRSVTFSYVSARTCFYQPTIAPGLLQSKSTGFRLEAEQSLVIGDMQVAALRMCAVPTDAPKEGVHAANLSLKGLSWLHKTYEIIVPDAPRVSIQSIGKHPLPASRALDIPIDAPDNIFIYKLAANGKSANCDKTNRQLRCAVPELELAQGTAYKLSLERYFNGNKINTVTSQDVTTLTATTVTQATLKEGEIVYAKPKSIELLTDKAVASASLELVRLEQGKRTTIDTKIERAGKKIVISWKDELPRQASFELIAHSIVGEDGSGLDGAYKLQFGTSGGPKVTNVSVGTYKVPMGAVATITFDQPLQDTQNLDNVVTLSGGAAIAGRKANQLMISFASVPKCGNVTVGITDALKSSYDIAGGSSWRFATRTICQTVGSIGASAKGRSILSYSFGSGSNIVLYTGAIHGNEVSTRSLMLRWIDALEAKPGLVPADKTVVVIPAINPDGFAAGTRTNARNVDLNRNFATADWKSDITTTSNAPFPGGGGASALSEPESQTLANYVARVKPRLVLSYHSIGGLLAANQTGDASQRATTYARLSGYSNTTGSSDTFEYGISGTADDYYGQILGVPSILVELGSHTSDQFSRNESAMAAMLQ